MNLRKQLKDLYRHTGLSPCYTALKLWILPLEECARALPPHGTILDVGCGYGFLANYLHLDGPQRHVIGNDVDAERIRIAQQTIRQRRNIEFMAGDSRTLPVAGFDGVVVADSLHHVPYAEQGPILRDLYDRLKPGGILVMRETDQKLQLRYLLFNCLLESLLYWREEKMQFRPAKEWAALLERLGYRVRRMEPNPPLSLYLTVTFVCVKPEAASASA